MFVFAMLRSSNVYGKICKLVPCRKSCSAGCFEILDYALKEAMQMVVMGVPSHQLTTNFSANCQLTTNFS